MLVKQLPQSVLNKLPLEIWEKIDKINRDYYLNVVDALTHRYPYKHYKKSKTETEFIYNFGLNPEEYQPSGTSNYMWWGGIESTIKITLPLLKPFFNYTSDDYYKYQLANYYGLKFRFIHP